MILRPFLNDESSCASYLFGCLTHSQLAVVDPHADLVDQYIDGAAAIGAPITAVFETHVQADHVSGLPVLVERTGARVLTGGQPLDRPGNYYAPTVLTDIKPRSPAYTEELFGPVAVLFRVPDEAEAIRLANDTSFGLGSSVTGGKHGGASSLSVCCCPA